MEKIKGVLLTFGISLVAYFLSDVAFLRTFGISPVIIGIVLGFILGNLIPQRNIVSFQSGVAFSSKKILRLGVILYGFSISVLDIVNLGLMGISSSILVVASTIFIGLFVGIKILRLDKELAILISSGSAICGAAAVMATSSTIKSSFYKASIAVGTVVIFGTTAMFLYPLFYKHGLVDFDAGNMGIYIGATIHEVAHVVAASIQVSPLASSNAITIKMIRVMLLVPFLLIISIFFKQTEEKKKLDIPWFAFMFLGAVAINSIFDLTKEQLELIKMADLLFLTMAMSALGFETTFKKIKDVGIKPFLLAGLLFLWLIFGGYCIVRLLLTFY